MAVGHRKYFNWPDVALRTKGCPYVVSANRRVHERNPSSCSEIWIWTLCSTCRYFTVEQIQKGHTHTHTHARVSLPSTWSAYPYWFQCTREWLMFRVCNYQVREIVSFTHTHTHSLQICTYTSKPPSRISKSICSPAEMKGTWEIQFYVWLRGGRKRRTESDFFFFLICLKTSISGCNTWTSSPLENFQFHVARKVSFIL